MENTQMKKGKSTLCITTGEIFMSTIEAANTYKLHPHSVYAICNNRQHQCQGYEFCYLEDAPYKVLKIAQGIRTKNKRILQEKLDAASKELAEAKTNYEAAQSKFDDLMSQIKGGNKNV